MKLALALALVLGVIALPAIATRAAWAQRYAVVIGNNAGRAHELPLEFAERDATRMADVLTSVGDVPPDQLVLVQAATAARARQALISTNERIRSQPQSSQSSQSSMLIVYYSGHSDAEALHMGSSSLPMSELEGLVRGSAARLRVLIVDSCRSGALTRKKGGRPAPAMQLRVLEPAGDGMVVLAASAAGEDAQESPELGGSFFTHHLLSGLLGAADADRDQRVTITEAYEYAYANTLRDSSATLGGTQHPSYRYDLRGQGEVVLTELRGAGGARAQLMIPAGLDVIVMRGSASGEVLAEARTPAASSGLLSLPPGKLFIRVRTAQALFEQALQLRGGRTHQLSTAEMDRIELTRLARKGGSHAPFVAGVGLSAGTHAGVSDRGAFCSGAGVHGSLVYRSLSVSPRLGACREAFRTGDLSSETTELQLALGLNMHRDLARVWSVYVGPELGVSYFRQRVEPFIGRASSRNVVGGSLAVQGGVDYLTKWSLAVGARLVAQTYFLELENPTRADTGVSAVFAWGATLGVTHYFR